MSQATHSNVPSVFFFFSVRRLDVLAARVAEREAKLYGELAYTSVDELWLKQQLEAKLP